jgi:hypothetical protein
VDSTAVYFWVKNDKDRYVLFVANRLAEVHNVLDELKQYQPEVCYVNTKENPADLLTRVRTVEEFKEQFNFWVKGPDFFTGGVEAWPPGPDIPESEKELELRKMFVTVNAAVTDAVDNDIKTANSLVKYAEKKGDDDATVAQVEELEKKIVREAQQAAFAKDIAELVALPQPREEGVLRSKIFTSGTTASKRSLPRQRKVAADGEKARQHRLYQPSREKAAAAAVEAPADATAGARVPPASDARRTEDNVCADSEALQPAAVGSEERHLQVPALPRKDANSRQVPAGCLAREPSPGVDVRLLRNRHGPLWSFRSPASKESVGLAAHLLDDGRRSL